MNFDEWMQRVDSFFLRGLGLTSAEVEDYAWWALWDEKLTPREAYDSWYEDCGPS